MKIKGFWHICMINEYMQIITEQLKLIIDSKLYDKVTEIIVGCSGTDENLIKVKKLFKPYSKIRIELHVTLLELYEFPTLETIYKNSQQDKFFGFYIHTKGVSWPKHEGGKYWRDYMNYYNLTKWKDCLKMLQKGYNLCGVKLLTEKDSPAFKLHYSGNFFWFKSTYVETLNDPFTLNIKNRIEAEMWIGSGKSPLPASLCQMFVDYNTKGKFMDTQTTDGVNYVHTLSWNLPSETEKIMERLYSQNFKNDFQHYIVDLGFPLEHGDKIPVNIKQSQQVNSNKLQVLAQRYGSKVMKLENIGVSQNWTNVFKTLKLKDQDVLIGADPDEHTLTHGWVNAMGKVLRSEQFKIGMVSLMMTDHVKLIKKGQYTEEIINGIRVWFPSVSINWALIGFSGEFLNKIKEIPYPKDCPRYGYIESMTLPYFDKLGFNWVILPDYQVKHTDFELGEPGASKLLREWKNLIIFKRNIYGQIDLFEFLKLKQEGKL